MPSDPLDYLLPADGSNDPARQRTIKQWNLWYNIDSLPGRPVRQKICWARTAIGDGSLEEQLIRLMVWVGASLFHPPEHTKLVDPVEILNSGKGWCDQQCMVFGFLCLHLLGTHARLVSLSHSDGSNGHTVAEVLFAKAWHLFDVHGEHQAIYRSPLDNHIMSFEEICYWPAIVEAQNHWWISPGNGEGKVGFFRPETEHYYDTALTSKGNGGDCRHHSLPAWDWPWVLKP